MDSDDEILPEARIFERRIDDIWNEKMDIYNQDFSFEEEEDDESIEQEEKLEKKDKKFGKSKIGKKGKISKGKEKKVEIKDIEEDENSILDSKARELLREIAAKKQAKSRRKNFSSTSGDEVIKLNAGARKRIRELEMETAREAKRVEEENKLVFAKCDSTRTLEYQETETVEDINREIFLKIRYQFKISKVKAKEKEEFKSVFQKVADVFGLKPTGILLCLGDTNIKLSDTPESLNIRICDIIDCIPYEEEEDANSSHMMLLKIQSNDTRKKTEIRAHKLEKFAEVMQKYADLRKLPLKSLTFEFDGEVIQPDETPLDLEMESGSCIDVRVAPVQKSPLKKPNLKELKNIPPIPIMDIVEID